VKVLDGPMAAWEPQPPPNALTVGVFDGVHKGHRVILGQLTATPYPSTVLTFDPHPAVVLSPGTFPRLLTTIEERVALLDRAGIDTVGVLDLSEIRHFEPQRFVSEVLVDKLGIGTLVTGSDFQFGKDRKGDVAFLLEAGERQGFDVVVVELLDSGGVVSSTRIRELIEAGDVSGAAVLLGSRFQLSNVVIEGDKRGRDLGFPTANLKPPPAKVIPGHGVYAAVAAVEGERHPAAVNVGVRPTFGGTELLIEAHILDFEDDLYGSPLTIEFVEKLRPELEFENAEALVERINDDVTRVRQILKSLVTT